MTELEEIKMALMDEQRDLLKKLPELDPCTQDYRDMQQAIANNTKMIKDLDNDGIEKKEKSEEIELRKKELKSKELEIKLVPVTTGLKVGGDIGKAALSGYLVCKTLVLLHDLESDSIMPGTKVNLVTRLLPFSK